MAKLEQFAKYISLTLEDDDQMLEIGRQRETDPKPLDVIPVSGGRRIVIASLKGRVDRPHAVAVDARAG